MLSSQGVNQHREKLCRLLSSPPPLHPIPAILVLLISRDNFSMFLKVQKCLLFPSCQPLILLCVYVCVCSRHPRSCAAPAGPRCWIADSIHRPPRRPAWFDTAPATAGNATASAAAVPLDATATHASPHDAQRAPAGARGLWDASPPRNENPLPAAGSLCEARGDAGKRGARRTRG